MGWLEKISIRIVPGKVELIESAPKYLEKRFLDTSPLALEQATKEIVRMLRLARESIRDAMNGFLNSDKKLMTKACQKEDAIDNLRERNRAI